MSASESERSFIKKVHLKGYKSIRDLSVELSDGLNIVIGANGSGKTNFLEFLGAACDFDFNFFLPNLRHNIEFSIENSNKELDTVKIKTEYTKTLSYTYLVEKQSNKYGYIKEFYDKNGKLLKQESDRTLINNAKEGIIYLTFNNPLLVSLQDKLAIEVIFTNDFRTSVLYHKTDNTFLSEMFFYDSETVVKDIIYSPKWFDTEVLKENLSYYSPIKNFLIDWNTVRESLDESYENVKSLIVEGIDFKFFVNDEWLNWSQLSDGTKRLFYIIGSVTYAKPDSIILLEEPELGVHPHQLSLLMNFLKSQSSDKQIIITTHSPQVLNCLEADELDRIIVARHEGKEGTKMYHLSDKEKGIVAKYMQNEAFIGDYWTLSGFMQEENAEVE